MMQYLPDGFEHACKRTEYWLVLNPMRGRAEGQQGFGPFKSPEDVLAYHDAELASDGWTDDGYRKAFKRGSELEWMNPLEQSERSQIGIFGHGVHSVVQYYDDPNLAPVLRGAPVLA